MKTITTILFVLFAALLCQGQDQLKLSIKKGSDAPNYETEHMYQMELYNPGTKASRVNISLSNKECSNIKKMEQIEFNQELLDKNKQSRIQQIELEPGKTFAFYIKLTRPKNARLNSWNCTEIVALSSEGKALSNAVTIESLVPNPNNNN